MTRLQYCHLESPHPWHLWDLARSICGRAIASSFWLLRIYEFDSSFLAMGARALSYVLKTVFDGTAT